MADSPQKAQRPTRGITVGLTRAFLCAQMMIGLQGLISQKETEIEAKLGTVCQKAKKFEDAAETSMKAMTSIYNNNREGLVHRYMSEVRFVERAEGLARNFSHFRERSSSLSQQLKELHRKAHKQIEELYRTEVDVDMQIRACKGTCKSVVPFTVDHHRYEVLQTDMRQMDNSFHQRKKAVVPPRDLPHITLRPVDVGPASTEAYKTIATVRRELLTQFEDIGQNQLVMECLLEKSAEVEAQESSELE